MSRELHIFRIQAKDIETADDLAKFSIERKAKGDSEAEASYIIATIDSVNKKNVGDISGLFDTIPSTDRVISLAKEIRFEQICNEVDDRHAYWRKSVTADESEEDGYTRWKQRKRADKAKTSNFVANVDSTATERLFLVPVMRSIVTEMATGPTGHLPILDTMSINRQNYPFSPFGTLYNNRLWDLMGPWSPKTEDDGRIFYSFAMVNT